MQLSKNKKESEKIKNSLTNPASHDKLLPLRYIITEYVRASAQIAQLVEQRTENPRVTGSIPVLGI